MAASNFNVNVEVASIATGNFTKTSHTKGENWFNAEKYPTINFTSAKITKTATGYLANGKLTMHGVTREIEISFTFSNTTNRQK